jgi:hypothetical protein
VTRQFENLDEMLESLRKQGGREVALTGKVATTTSPRGQETRFRGRLVVSAQIGAQRAEYVEQVEPYVARTEPRDIPVTQERAADLRRFRLALTAQLRAYREEYRDLMDAARASLIEKLRQAGLDVVEPEE